MAGELFELFVWHAPDRRYRWVNPEKVELDIPGPFLTDGMPYGETVNYRAYAPLEEFPSLFKTLADTERTQEGISGFAKNYGTLWLWDLQDGGWYDESGAEIRGASLRQWVWEMQQMRQAITLWILAKKNDQESLKRYIHWDGQETVKYQSDLREEAGIPERGSQIIASEEDTDPDVWRRVRPGDLIKPTLMQVQTFINSGMSNLTTPLLRWDRGDLRFRVIPLDLISALWLQFALAISQKKNYRSCQLCGTWFELGSGKMRTSRLFCSDACRLKEYRNRQIEARRLYGKGKSFEEIARQLRTSPRTVRGWVKKANTPDRNSGDTD